MALPSFDPWAVCALAASSGEEGGGFSLMQIDPGTILWTLIIFVLVVLLLGKIAWKPILKMVQEREKRIREALEKAERAQADAAQALSQQKDVIAKQRQESAEFLAKAREDALKSGEEVLAKARKEAVELTERARRQILEEKNRAVDEVRKHAVDLAIDAAGHLLGKTIDEERHKAIVREYIRALPDSLRKH